MSATSDPPVLLKRRLRLLTLSRPGLVRLGLQHPHHLGGRGRDKPDEAARRALHEPEELAPELVKLGMAERAFTPSASSICVPATSPAFTTRLGLSFAKSTRTFASTTGSAP